MRIMKRSLALIMALCLVMGLMIPTAFAATTGTGTREDPLVCDAVADLPSSVTVPAGDYLFFVVPAGGMELTVTDNTTAVNIVGPMYQNLAYTSDGMGVATLTFDSYADGEQVLFGLYNQNPGADTTVEMSIGAPAPAELGSELNPISASFFDGASCFLMNEDLEAGDSDGIWYTVEANRNGVMYVDVACYAEVSYGVDVYQGSFQGVSSEGNPIITFPVVAGEVITIHKYVDPDLYGNYPAASQFYVSAVIVGATAEEPVILKSTEVKVPVASGAEIYLSDSTKEASFSGAGLIISGYSEAIKVTTVTVNGVEYTDEDGDGMIEITTPGSYYDRPIISIKNGHEWNIGYTFTAVDEASEDHIHTLNHFEAVEADCHSNGNIEHWYCNGCGCYFENAEATIEILPAIRVNTPATGAVNVTHVPAVDPTCNSTGNIEYWICEDCGGYFSDEACTQEILPAIRVMLPALEHENVEHFEAVEATCHSNGNIEYWYCADCDGHFSDEACTQEILPAIRVITPATGAVDVEHVEANEATCHTAGVIEHWVCGGCNGCFSDEACTQEILPAIRVNTPATGAVNVTHVPAVDPTCNSTGNIEHWVCEDCGGCFADEACTQEILPATRVTLPALEHENVEHFEAVEATCHSNGNIEYWYCADCDGHFSDEACTQEILPAIRVTLPALGSENYTFVEAEEPVCHHNGYQAHYICNECNGYFMDEALTQETIWQRLVIPTEISLEYHEEIPACHANGMKEYWYCAECDTHFSDAEGKHNVAYLSLTILADTELVHMEAVDACHANGTQEYWFCPDCEAVYADAEGKILTNRMNLTIPADTEPTYVKEVPATATTNGMKEHYYCAECDCYFIEVDGKLMNVASKSLVIPATGAPADPSGPSTTGDPIMIFVILAVVAAAGMAVMVILNKKKYNV